MADQKLTTDLLLLQGKIKRDPDGYREEMLVHYGHYGAQLAVFALKPEEYSKELADLVMFMAQIAHSYPKELGAFPRELMSFMEEYAGRMNPALRKHVAQALILLRNRKALLPAALLPLFFRLFQWRDKSLRKLLYSHIVNDISRCNQNHRDEKLNKSVQSFLYKMVQEEHETAAKKSLDVLGSLYRSHVWADENTVNIIVTALFHKTSRIMVTALKFFLGADADENDDDDDDSGPDERGAKKQAPLGGPLAMDKEAVYKAFHKGTLSSKKRKQKKLKRVMRSLKRAQRTEGEMPGHVSFSAIHLIRDPQGVAEKLFSRLRSCNERFEVKLMLMNVISRIVGSHKLVLLNFYPFLQRYVEPHQRQVTAVLAAAVQAVHDEVPPDAFEPLLRHLVDKFVHDRSRPEAVAVGLNTVHEICARAPLAMTEELLRDLVQYKKAREKPVVTAARRLIALFRERAPGLLEKRDRGRGADLETVPMAFGAQTVLTDVPGVELLLEESEEEGEEQEDSDGGSSSDDEGGEGSEGAVSMDEDEGASGSEEDGGSSASGMSDSGEERDELEEEAGGQEGERHAEGTEGVRGGPAGGSKRKRGDEDEGGTEAEAEAEAPLEGQSLRQLKRRALASVAGGGEVAGAAAAGVVEHLADGILSDADFQKIRERQGRRAVETAMAKHGLRHVKGKEAVERARTSSSAAGQHLHDKRVKPEDLQVAMKARRNKAQRLASVLEGRQDRGEYGASTASKHNKKGGGLTNREKQKRKKLPLAAIRMKAKKRVDGARRKAGIKKKQFRGKKAWK